MAKEINYQTDKKNESGAVNSAESQSQPVYNVNNVQEDSSSERNLSSSSFKLYVGRKSHITLLNRTKDMQRRRRN